MTYIKKECGEMKKRYFLIMILALCGVLFSNTIIATANGNISTDDNVDNDAVSSIYMYDAQGNKVSYCAAGTFAQGDTYQITGIYTDKEDELIYQSSSSSFASVDSNGLVTIKCNDIVSRADIAVYGFLTGYITVTPKSNPNINVKIVFNVIEKKTEEKNDTGADSTDTKQDNVKTDDAATDNNKDIANTDNINTGDTNAGDNSKVQVNNKVEKAKINRTKVKNRSIRIDYSAAYAGGYKLQISTKKKFTKKTTKEYNTSKRTFTVKKLKRNTVYYIRVRGRNDAVYGKWSKVKKVKTKK